MKSHDSLFVPITILDVAVIALLAQWVDNKNELEIYSYWDSYTEPLGFETNSRAVLIH